MKKKRLASLFVCLFLLLSFCACQPALSPMEEVKQAFQKTMNENGFDFSGKLSLNMESGGTSLSYDPVKVRVKTLLEEGSPVAFESQVQFSVSGTDVDMHVINSDRMLYGSYSLGGMTLYTKQPLFLPDIMQEWENQNEADAPLSIRDECFSITAQKSTNLSVYTLSLTEEGKQTLSAYIRALSTQAGMPDSILQKEAPKVESLTWTMGVDPNGYMTTLHMAMTLCIEQENTPVRMQMSLSGNVVNPGKEVSISLPEDTDRYQDVSSLFLPEEDPDVSESTIPASFTYYDDSKEIYEYEELDENEIAIFMDILNQNEGYIPSQEEQSTVLNSTQFACFQPFESTSLYFLPYEENFPLCDTINHVAYSLTDEQRASLVSILHAHNLCTDLP